MVHLEQDQTDWRQSNTPACTYLGLLSLSSIRYKRLNESVTKGCAAGGYAQRIFVKQVTKVLEDLLAALKAHE